MLKFSFPSSLISLSVLWKHSISWSLVHYNNKIFKSNLDLSDLVHHHFHIQLFHQSTFALLLHWYPSNISTLLISFYLLSVLYTPSFLSLFYFIDFILKKRMMKNNFNERISTSLFTLITMGSINYIYINRSRIEHIQIHPFLPFSISSETNWGLFHPR